MPCLSARAWLKRQDKLTYFWAQTPCNDYKEGKIEMKHIVRAILEAQLFAATAVMRAFQHLKGFGKSGCCACPTE